ncbi:MAG: ABC transporter permease [Planctomycetes bacterium]|nr:ABC transporter permease [Planctomycetota bacterium]
MPRPNILANIVSRIGAGTSSGLVHSLDRFGHFWMFSGATASFIPLELGTVRGWRRLLPQCYHIGTRSVPVIMLTGMFIGMVLIVQGWAQFDAANMSDRLGAIIIISVCSELGPVLAGVMMAGRAGGALTAELGTMNITEQLLALKSMGADPIRHLVTPRFVACTVLAPLLTCYANLMGTLGAWAVYVVVYHGDSEPFWYYAQRTVELWDVGSGLFKSVFFGAAIGLVSCYNGFHCKPGAEGVGQACTQSFVISFILILMLDLFLGFLLNGLYAAWFGFRSLI